MKNKIYVVVVQFQGEDLEIEKDMCGIYAYEKPCNDSVKDYNRRLKKNNVHGTLNYRMSVYQKVV